MRLPGRQWIYNDSETAVHDACDPAKSGIKAHSIASKEPSHHCSKGSNSRSKQKMGVVRDEHPRITVRLSLRQEFCQAIEEIPSIPVVYEYLSTLYPPDHDVMQHTGRLSACGYAQAGVQPSLS